MDFDEFDRERWEAVDVFDMPAELQWRVLDRLDRLGLVDYRGLSQEPKLRLWRKGRRTLADLVDDGPPLYCHCPRWVNALLLAGGRGDPLATLTEENVAAGEAVARMTVAGGNNVDYMVALRAMLTGEPTPAEGGWRRT